MKVSTVTNSGGVLHYPLSGDDTRSRLRSKDSTASCFRRSRWSRVHLLKSTANLLVGKTSTVVQVKGDLEPLLDTEDAMTTTTLDSTAIENITNNGRNFSLFTALIPGAVDTYAAAACPGSLPRSGTRNADFEIGANGNRAQGNDYVLDGVEINETITNLIGYNPNLDALSEVKVSPAILTLSMATPSE